MPSRRYAGESNYCITFGEEYNVENCSNYSGCDNCVHPKEQFEGEELVSIAITAALETNSVLPEPPGTCDPRC